MPKITHKKTFFSLYKVEEHNKNSFKRDTKSLCCTDNFQNFTSKMPKITDKKSILTSLFDESFLGIFVEHNRKFLG